MPGEKGQQRYSPFKIFLKTPAQKSIASSYRDLELHKRRLNWEASWKIVSILQRSRLSLPNALGLVGHQSHKVPFFPGLEQLSYLAQIRQEAREYPPPQGHKMFWEG